MRLTIGIYQCQPSGILECEFSVDESAIAGKGHGQVAADRANNVGEEDFSLRVTPNVRMNHQKTEIGG